jgi:MFS family permease
MTEFQQVAIKIRRIFGLHPNIFFMGLVSFLTDVSSEMIFTLLPLFLANVLGVAPVIVGVIEGVAESTASLLKLVSGWLSDKSGKRKSLAIAGYGLSTLVKPLMYVATTWGVVLGIRFTDRLGKGIRTAPRDALIADSLAAHERGKGFGIHRAMDTSGAALGLILAAIVVFLLQGGSLNLGLETYQRLVLIGIVPAVLSLFIFFLVSDIKKSSIPQSYSDSKSVSLAVNIVKQDPKVGLDRRFKFFLGIMVLFTLGNFSSAFLILRAQNLGNCVLDILLMLVLLNVVCATLSTPAGLLSDKLGRKWMIIIGWIVYAITCFGFASALASWQIWFLFALYGVYQGFTEGVARAFVADLVPEDRRGTAYGLFHSVVGVALLPASIIAGWLWQSVSPASAFYFGAGLSFIAMVGLLTLVRK